MDFLILLLFNAAFADYIEADTISKIIGSPSPFNQTYDDETFIQSKESSSTYHKRYMDGMYGIGSQDYLINTKIHFLGLENFVNNELEWFNFDSNSTSLGCHDGYHGEDVENKIGLILKNYFRLSFSFC